MKSIKKNIFIWIVINSCLFLSTYCFSETDQFQQDIENNTPVEKNRPIEEKVSNKISVDDQKENNIFQELQNTQKKVQQLMNEIEKLNNEITKIHIENKRSKTNMEYFHDDLDELNDIVKRNELKSYLDRLNFYAELRTRCDWFEFKGHDTKSMFDPTIEYYDEKVHMLGSNRLRLNITADLLDNVKFNSRIGVFYNWNDQNYNRTPLMFLYGERERTDTSLRVERAYVDYFIDKFELVPVAFSFGRLPTTDGLSTDFRENTPRRSTFPAMSYETLADGFGFSVNLKNILPLTNPALRFMYCKINEGNNDVIFRDHRFDMKSDYCITAQFETALDPLLDNSFVIFHYGLIKDNAFNMYDNNTITIPEGTQLFPGAITTKDSTVSLHPIGKLPDSIGSIHKFSLYYQGKNIIETGVDFFAGYAVTRSSPSGHVTRIGTSLSNIDNNLAQTIGNIEIPLISFGMFDENNKTPHNGNGLHCGLRYTLPIHLLNSAKMGAEYFKSSKYWFGLNLGPEDPLKAMDVAGTSYNLYYIQPFNKWISLRLGHHAVNYDFKSGLVFYFNSPIPVDWKVTNTYCLVDAVF